MENKFAKNILSALAVAFFGFIMLNLAFIVLAIYQGILRLILTLFIPITTEETMSWLPFFSRCSFIIIIFIISFFIFRSNLKVLYKSIYMTIPTAAVLVNVGIFLSNWKPISLLVGGFLCLSTIYYLYRNHKHWLYYYSVGLVGIALAIFSIFGGDI